MKKGKNKAMDGVKITPEIIAEMRDVIFSLNTAMDAASTIPASAFVGRDVSRLFNLAATQARAVISKLATTQSRQERETATLHAPEALPEHAADSASAARTEATLWQRKYDEASTQLAAAQSEVGRLTKERDEVKRDVDKRVEDFLNERACCSGHECGCMGVSRLEQYVWEEAGAHLATLRRERDELRAELLTTHQMACRVGLERDELAKLLGEAADELAVPGYDAPPISKGVQNLLSRIRAALQSLRALTEQPGKP